MDVKTEVIHKKDNSQNILLTNIQRFSLHDGPGIRTTVFLKGCSVRCPWCSNPENLVNAVQKYVRKGKDGRVEEAGEYGQWYSCEELYAEVIKDKSFYGSCGGGGDKLASLPGGVTFSGGECMMQMKELKPLLERLNAEDIHMAAETSLFATPDCFSIAIKHIGLFYVDIKIMDEEQCKMVLGGKLTYYKENLETLLKSGKPVVFRLPVIGGYTDSDENRRAAVELIKSCASYHNLIKIELLKEHNLGTNKYQLLLDAGNDIKMPDYKGVSDDLMKQYKCELERGLTEVGSDIPIEICKI